MDIIKAAPKYIIIKCYDKERYRTTKNGTVSKSFRTDDPDLEGKVAAFKQEVKTRNEEFTRKLKAGEIIPVRRIPAYQLAVEMITSNVNNANNANNAQVIANNANNEHGVGGALKSPEDKNSDNVYEQMVANIRVKSPIPTTADRTKFELKLDPHTGNTIFLIGATKAGKSTALMKIYDKYYAGDPNLISVLWTKNPQISLYRGHKRLLKCGVWNSESEQLIRMEKRIQTRTHNEYKFLNMFDDILNLRNNQLLDDMIMTYRNSKMSSVISIQYSNKLDKCSRANMSNVLAFNLNTDEAIEVTIKTFLLGYTRRIGLKTMEDKINWYKSMTRDHGFIYIKPAEDHVSFHKFNLKK